MPCCLVFRLAFRLAERFPADGAAAVRLSVTGARHHAGSAAVAITVFVYSRLLLIGGERVSVLFGLSRWGDRVRFSASISFRIASASSIRGAILAVYRLSRLRDSSRQSALSLPVNRHSPR